MTDTRTPEERDLAHQVLARIEDEAAKGAESRWYQQEWRLPGDELGRSCGTAMCFAGWAVELSPHATWRTDDPLNVEAEFHHAKTDGIYESAEHIGRDLLGLNRGDADWLFSASNTLPRLRALVAALDAGQSLYEVPYDDERDDPAW